MIIHKTLFTQLMLEKGFLATTAYFASYAHKEDHITQYLRAVDLHTGQPRWKVLTTSPLENSPAIYGDVLYQRIPSNGLACYETFPNDYAGKLKWTAEDVHGNVITTTSQGRLVCWDDNTKQLQILDSHIGTVTASILLPTAKQVLASDTTNGALFILTEDGDIIRLALREK